LQNKVLGYAVKGRKKNKYMVRPGGGYGDIDGHWAAKNEAWGGREEVGREPRKWVIVEHAQVFGKNKACNEGMRSQVGSGREK